MSRVKHPGKLTGSGRVKWNDRVSLGTGRNVLANPISMARTVKAETIIGGWGGGPGNNVSNVQNGVNAEPDRVAKMLDRTAGARQAQHIKTRRTDAYKMAHAEAKRNRRKGGGVDGYGKSVPCQPRPLTVDASQDGHRAWKSEGQYEKKPISTTPNTVWENTVEHALNRLHKAK